MSYSRRKNSYLKLLKQAEALLDCPVSTFTLDWDLDRLILRNTTLLARHGLDELAPRIEFSSDRRGKKTEIGIDLYETKLGNPSIRIVRVACYWPSNDSDPWYNFWAVPKNLFETFSKRLKRWRRKSVHQTPPIMIPEARTRLWKNTIGFLRQDAQLLKTYGVLQRRGVLLLGDPGNGKTMASRWLRHYCNRYKFAWNTVSVEQYEYAKANGCVKDVFSLRNQGIIHFDDFDIYLRNRQTHQASTDHTTFLTELDGVTTRRGVVYLFTSNAKLDELDPAFLRPGRIDQIIYFPLPDEALRRTLIETTWHEDIRNNLDLRLAIRQTEGCSFAEMDEIKKLLVLNYFETKEWDWKLAYRHFQQDRKQETQRKIGFDNCRTSETKSNSDSLAISAMENRSP